MWSNSSSNFVQDIFELQANQKTSCHINDSRTGNYMANWAN